MSEGATIPTPVPGVKVSTNDVIRIAVVATAVVLAWETVAFMGIFDWHSIPQWIASHVGPKAGAGMPPPAPTPPPGG